MCLPLIGGLVSAAGTLIGAMQARAAHRANAEYLKRQAFNERQKAGFDTERLSRRADRLISGQVSAFASNGININSGSVADVVSDTATEVALDVGAIAYNARTAADNLKAQADIEEMHGRHAMIGGVIGAISPIIGAVQQMTSPTSFGQGGQAQGATNPSPNGRRRFGFPSFWNMGYSG